MTGDPPDGALGVETGVEAGDISIVLFTEEDIGGPPMDGGSC